MLDVKLIRKQHSSYPAIFKAINKNFLPKAGVTVQNEAVKNIRDKNIIDTGRLKNSIKYKVSKDKVTIGTNVEYAPYLEYGHRAGKTQVPARSYLRPALDNNRKFLVALWESMYKKVFAILGAG